MKIKSVFNAAGGLSYHWLALRYQKKLWRPFHSELAKLLKTWEPKSGDLVLVGPSAGYSLPTDFLRRFTKVLVNDVDPVARSLFRLNHFLAKHLQFDPEDHFQLEKIRADYGNKTMVPEDAIQIEKTIDESLGKFFSVHKNCAFLFCNILGQIPILLRGHLEESGIEMVMKAIAQALRRHEVEWASYHDVYSWVGSGTVTVDKHFNVQVSTAKSIFDHGTKVFWQSNSKPMIWNLSPKQGHVIAWVTGQSNPFSKHQVPQPKS
jgi:hypothetical protein